MRRIDLERMAFGITLFTLIPIIALLTGIIYGEVSIRPGQSFGYYLSRDPAESDQSCIDDLGRTPLCLHAGESD
jgi:hypothetical protein